MVLLVLLAAAVRTAAGAGAPATAETVRLLVVVAAPMIAAVVLSSTLQGPDAALERCAPRLSSRWRAGHGCVAVAVASGALAWAAAPSPAALDGAAMARNTTGLLGAVLLTAALLPSVLSWVPAVSWAAVTYLAGPRSGREGSEWYAWLLQPGGLDGSWVVAVLLLVTGVLEYAVRGPQLTAAPTG
ncbi:hypothetical protein [Quadrisphaera sp. DSM 44207]|uniref:hypothetical protein n=1 Tax=Quadrisphaera sp. DSM 44207 TaxID=1881057 RepID=UPI0008840E70|nr:hypothetical protein [Quadrisphaera sp. DSM 44207]SDQ06820.1 hypothetical protein SAMN05428996_0327 [Quadrisphaera sp. DSM 44207]